MKQYYIKLKKNKSAPLQQLLQEHLNLDNQTVHSLITCGAVWNNDKKQRIKQPHFVVSQETIVVNKPAFPVKPYPFQEQDILFEDKWLFVIYKQPLFPTVPTPYSDINSLVYGLNQYLQTRQGKFPARAFAVNRLDLSTSGLVLLAKDKQTEAGLHALFKQRRIRKWYLVKTAILEQPEDRYVLEDELQWKEKKRHAKTVVTFCKHTADNSFFLARPLTGRTHQIRKHFAAYVAPVYGDDVYGPYTWDEELGLLCCGYIFYHPVTGEKMVIKHLPAAWRQALEWGNYSVLESVSQ